MDNKQKTSPSLDQTLAQFIDAGIGLAMLPFSMAQQTFESTKQSSQSRFDDLQARGEKLESDLKDKLDPFKQQANLTNLCNQFSLFLSPKASREAKLDTLSKKIDTLVELVATLAAKQAAQKAEAEPKSSTKSTATKPKTTRRRTSSAAAKSTAKPATTRKRTAASKTESKDKE